MMIKRKKRGPIVKTVEQAKRLIKTVVGFTVIIGGTVMLVTPGPGIVTMLIGLAILATEFVWARKLMKRFEHHANNLKNSVLNNYRNKINNNEPQHTANRDNEPRS